jgi:chemotaxis methyl-accepting protein methylase
MAQRLWDRVQQLNLASYTDYYHYVAHNPNGNGEWLQLLDSLLNNETSFFRHEPSFNALRELALPELLRQKRRQGGNSMTVWSAGCSAGQEPYSLAMTLLEQIDSHLWQLRVIGSDISQSKLAQARQGQYKQHEVRYMPDYYREKYLRWVQTAQGAHYQVVQRVQALVQFGYLNFKEPQTCWVHGQDIIFCQNVLIYFKPDHRLEIVKLLIQRLNPGGFLFLAPAEMVGLRIPGVTFVNAPDSLVYRKDAAG